MNRSLPLVSFTIGALGLLLKKGANPKVQSVEIGETPLQHVVARMRILKRCNEKGAALLLEYGRVDVPNYEGHTRLGYSRKQEDETMALYLIEGDQRVQKD